MKKLLSMGAIEPAPPTPGFYSRLFVVMKASGDWRPVIDLSILNKFVEQTPFKMETVQSVLSSIRKDDWMISLDLKDAYFQVPIHPDSRKYLRFCVQGEPFQFKALCFGLSTAPQVFTRVMAPISAILHDKGIRMLRYLDDWLISAPSKDSCLQARDETLRTCETFGIAVNLAKSTLEPTQLITYLGIVIESQTLRVSPTPSRQENLKSLVTLFLSQNPQPASLWQRVLGHLASLTQLIPGGRLRTRSMQWCLRKTWDWQDQEAQIPWDLSVHQDLQWWTDPARLQAGRLLKSLPPDIALWSDASDQGWGAHLDTSMTSGLWSPEEKTLSINVRELMAIQRGLNHFQPLLLGRVVAIYSDNTTALSYLRNQGGTHSVILNSIASQILRWAEHHLIELRPQFVMGKKNVLADTLSRSRQVLGAEWTLHQEVVQSLLRKWPANVDLFATSMNFRLPTYFSPVSDPQAAGIDSFLQNWSNLQAYAFPPFPTIRQVLNKARESRKLHLTLVAPMWRQKEWFPDLQNLCREPPIPLPIRRDLLRQPHFHRFHLNPQTLQLHAWRLVID